MRTALIARLLAEPFLQSQRGRRSALLGSVDHERKHVAAILRPSADQLRELVELLRIISGCHNFTQALQSGVAEAPCVGIDAGELVVVPKNDGHAPFAA
jgi:hypothetical protein